MAWLEPSPTDRERRDLGGGAEAPSAFETPGDGNAYSHDGFTIQVGGDPADMWELGGFSPRFAHAGSPAQAHAHPRPRGIHFHILLR